MTKYRTNDSLGKWFLTLANKRVLFVLAISLFACFAAIRIHITFSRSTILYGLVISFPLLFSIQEAYKRREKALEYMSAFKASMQITLQSFYLAKKISRESNDEIKSMLEDLSNAVLSYLELGTPTAESLYDKFQNIFLFMFNHRSEISSSVNMRISHHIETAYTSVVYLVSLAKHGTMIPLRKIGFVFIYLFPIIQAPVLVGMFGNAFPEWLIYLISALSSLLLFLFLLIQEQIENPFDQTGPDDIRLQDFKLTISHMPVIKDKTKSVDGDHDDTIQNEDI